MNYAEVNYIAMDFMFTAVALSLPAILASLIVGIVISVLQTMTSIQEQTLTFAPRILAVVAVFLLTLPWMLQTLISFSMRMMVYMAEAGR